MIKVVLTIDVEPDVGKQNSYSGITIAMPRLLDLIEQYDIPFTWFITHDFWDKIDEKFPSIVRRMAKNGEIGCHVHFRNENKEYYTDYRFQKELIENATNALRSHGFDVASFRGGALFFNEDTLKILEELGYTVDSSVMPGLYNKPATGLVVNHKRCTTIKPYFISREDHCLSGDSEILEVPLLVHPRISFKTNMMTLFLASPLNLGSVIKAPVRALDKIKGLGASNKGAYITLSYHSWNFLSEIDEQLTNLERFFVESKSLPSWKFSTLKEIRANLSQDYRNNENLKSSRIVITWGNLSRLNRMDKWMRLRKWSKTR